MMNSPIEKFWEEQTMMLKYKLLAQISFYRLMLKLGLKDEGDLLYWWK